MTGNGYVFCQGITNDETKIYVIFESSSESYTNTGAIDAIIMQFEMNGRLSKG